MLILPHFSTLMKIKYIFIFFSSNILLYLSLFRKKYEFFLQNARNILNTLLYVWSKFFTFGNNIKYSNHHHHHHIVLAARISLTLSRHSSLSFIALGRSSGQQPVSSHSCWMYVRAGRPAHKTEYMCYNQTGDISTLEGTPLKLVDKFTYLGSSVESTEKDIETRLTKAWTAINRLSIIWKSDLTDKMKRSFFQAAVTSILLYGCTTWTLTKRLEKKLDGNYTRMLRAILNKSWQQHPTRHQLYGHLPPITKTIQVRRTRHAGHCWRSRDELIRDVLLWIPTHGRAKAGRNIQIND